MFNCTCKHEVKEHLSNGCSGDESSCLCNGTMREDRGEDVSTIDTVVNCECEHEVQEHGPQGCFADRGECGCRGKRTQLPLTKVIAGFVPLSEVINPGGFGTAAFYLRNCSCSHSTLEHGSEGCERVTNGTPCVCKGVCVDERYEKKPIVLPPPSNAVDDFDCCICESYQEASVCTCDCHLTDSELQRMLKEKDTAALHQLATEGERIKREKAKQEGKQFMGSM